ncbi:hypothetical protein OG216_34915 [Streptomycetaceae bacterium NBC_01309]
MSGEVPEPVRVFAEPGDQVVDVDERPVGVALPTCGAQPETGVPADLAALAARTGRLLGLPGP